MPNNEYQLGLLNSETHVLQLANADIEYHPQFIADDEANQLYERLLANTDWQQDTVKVYGKEHLTPRLSSWVGEPWMSYSYSNNTMTPVAWSNTLINIKQQIETATQESFNSVLVNYYRDGQDSNGWHSDDEPELGHNPVIASLSLGAPRDFHLRHKRDKQLRHTMTLEHGSLLMMRGTTQQHWQHTIPKRAHANGRINLTFRTIMSKRQKST